MLVGQLIEASFKGYQPIVQFLVGKGADVTLREENGISALDFAKLKKFTEIIKILEIAR